MSDISICIYLHSEKLNNENVVIKKDYLYIRISFHLKRLVYIFWKVLKTILIFSNVYSLLTALYYLIQNSLFLEMNMNI